MLTAGEARDRWVNFEGFMLRKSQLSCVQVSVSGPILGPHVHMDMTVG